MGSLRLTFCAGAVVAAALVPTLVPGLAPTPVAFAADGGVTVTPSSPAPGSDLRLVVRGCKGKTGTAKSEAFVADVLLARQDGALVGGSRVRSSLTPGTYDVTVGCDGQDGKVKGTIAVVEARAEEKKEEGAGKSSAEPAEPAASPVAPVPAGGGGGAERLAAEARDTGPGTRHAVIGLVLAGVAAVAVVVRGVRRSRGTD
ncbi:hypothetical protein ACH4TV_06855 [Streptomyces sp. NPDC020898]|uniref:hypothetical protein n=1 Tax=Streptomyces sp. NPDC020898 TaxID=3365101 RepID=UPI0037939D17